jgi:hypothetical protein
MKYILNTFLAAAAVFTFSACNDDEDNWKAGDPVSDDSPAVYFADDNTFSQEFETDDHTFQLHLKRLNAASAVTVPLESTVDDSNIVVPQSVTFEAGQTDAYITVDCTNIPSLQQLKYTITIPESYGTPYAAGTDVFDGTVAIVEWRLVDDTFLYYYYDTGSTMMHPKATGELWYLEGSSVNGAVKLKLTNFMESGKDLIFHLDATQSGCSETYIGIVPDYNYYYDPNNTDYGCWYFYDQTNEEWPSWTLSDGHQVDYAYVYGVGYSYFNLESGYGCFSCYLTDDTWADYYQVWTYFDIPDDLKDKITYAK